LRGVLARGTGMVTGNDRKGVAKGRRGINDYIKIQIGILRKKQRL
jgi:hypothetical protein